MLGLCVVTGSFVANLGQVLFHCVCGIEYVHFGVSVYTCAGEYGSDGGV